MSDTEQTLDHATETADAFSEGLSILENLYSAGQAYLAGMSRYTTDFYIPYLLASQYFQRVELKRTFEESPADTIEAYLHLLENNLELVNRSIKGTADMMSAYAQLEMPGFSEAMQQIITEQKYDKLTSFTKQQSEVMDMVTNSYPKSIDDIGPEFGFHFERGEHLLLDETDRFLLYRIAPSLKQVKTRLDAKPILIIPPFVLGANILGFLPNEQRSYAHCFANQGFPTYIRILKDIDTSPALQIMTGEDDARDTRRFCEAIMKAHGKPVTLNGYCQGGYSALCNLLTGELDGLVDAFITCVSPMDGTRSKGLARFLMRLPQRFNDLEYGTKILSNGNELADGKLMGWVYKIKSIEHEIPAAAFYRDLMMFARQKSGNYSVSKTAAALNYWLQKERYDLPLEITRMSFASYNVPITDDGTLPVRLFDKDLNLKRLKEKNIKWLICYGTHDDLVEKDTALAPLDHIDAEVTPFPKGHVAIATSWSAPDSAYALHTRFGEENYRGPVLFHMDMDAALTKAGEETPKAIRRAATKPPAPKATRRASTASSAVKAKTTRKKAVKKSPAARKT
ncbi:MAG: metal transporter, partial [Deltaproteobacteria bacterium]|nr:metal transporter [Deltaproteobacteria bacterium]